MKKIVSIMLSLCMVMLSVVPAFASAPAPAMKAMLSEESMGNTVGGGGRLQATIVTCPKPLQPKATTTAYNTTGTTIQYQLGDEKGQIIASGTVPKGVLLQVSGKFTGVYANQEYKVVFFEVGRTLKGYQYWKTNWGNYNAAFASCAVSKNY